MEYTKDNTEIAQLIIFDVLMQRKSIAETALALNISQLRITRVINTLKVLYNDPLFIRKKGILIPSERAILLHNEIQVLLPEIDRVSLTTSDNHQIVIACSSHIAASAAPLLFQLTKDTPYLTIKHLPLPVSTKDQMTMLCDKSVDIVFDYLPIGHADILFKKLYKEEFVVVCSKDHPRLTAMINLKEYLREFHAVLEGSSSCHMNENANIDKIAVGFSSYSYLALLSVVEVSEMVCILPGDIYLKIKTSFNVKSLPYSFKIGIPKNTLYMSYLKDHAPSSFKKNLLKKIESMR